MKCARPARFGCILPCFGRLLVQRFYNFTRFDLESWLDQRGRSRAHALTLLRGFYKQNGGEPALGSLGPELRQAITTEFSYDLPVIDACRESAYDGAVKFGMRLSDGAVVETVLMPESARITVCLSSQVGCAQGCVFCHTGRMGLSRNLVADEIVGQVVAAERWILANPAWLERARLPRGSRVTNLVFMGMGEPCDNAAEVNRAISIFRDPMAFNLTLRRISVSTAGHLDGLRAITAAHPEVSLALSLHATNNEQRSRIMPINRRWPIDVVLGYLRAHYNEGGAGRVLLVQYTVINGVNDRREDAIALAQLLADLPVKINLIPLNEISVSRLASPTPARLEAFRDSLYQAGFRVMVRYSKGQDITAACGQLALQG